MSDSEGVCGNPEGEEASGVEAIPDGEKEEEEKKQQEPLGPYQPDNPVGKMLVKLASVCVADNFYYQV